MNSLELFHLCRRIGVIPLSRGFRTDAVLRRRGVPLRKPKDFGIRHRNAALGEDSGLTEDIEHEGDLDDEVDIMNIDRAYDLNKREKAKERTRLHYAITSKKFFSPRPQPSMLTCNERQCIKHLHKEDPVQWNLKTLSESFPATTVAIKKIINSKWKISPERAKILDSKVQKNWELLAEGKLDAEPKVLEHFKKFINRREVLLEQIKNADFYLPEVKKEKVWNKGEFSGILRRYEKAFEKLALEAEKKDQPKMLKDGMENEKSSVDTIHEKIGEEVSKRSLENKDSFMFGSMSKFYSKQTTLENLEDEVLKQADRGKHLKIEDRAILETKLGAKSESNTKLVAENEENLEKLYKTQPPKREERKIRQNLHSQNRIFMEANMNEDSLYRNKMGLKKEEMLQFTNEYEYPDERTAFTSEAGVGQLLKKLESIPEKPPEKPENKLEKPKIDFSDPGRLERENRYYDNEVRDITDTAFWNSGRQSHEKALAETQKEPHCGPLGAREVKNPAPTVLLSTDAYPERIKIPKHHRGSGLTFKVKDCYYDDDGEFLYRVPGMTK